MTPKQHWVDDWRCRVNAGAYCKAIRQVEDGVDGAKSQEKHVHGGIECENKEVLKIKWRYSTCFSYVVVQTFYLLTPTII